MGKLILFTLLIPALIASQAFGVIFDNIKISGNTISSLNTNGDIVVDANGTGRLLLLDLTPLTVLYIDAAGRVQSSAVTPTELGYLSGVTGGIQTQINDLDGDLGNHEAATTSVHGIADTSQLVTLTTSLNSVLLSEQSSTPATPSAGVKKLYAKTNGKVYTLSSSGNEIEVGAGGGGGSGNVLANPSFEDSSSTSGWTITSPAVCSTTSPTDFVDDSPDAKQSISCIGPGVNGKFLEQCKEITGDSLNFEASLWLKTSNDNIQVCISIDGVERDCSYSTDATSTWKKYRATSPTAGGKNACVYAKTTASSSISAKADVAYLGLNRNVGSGPIVSEWKTYPMVIGATTTAPTKASSPTVDVAKWRQVGDSIQVSYNYEYYNNAGAAAGSGTYLFPIPSICTVDQSKLALMNPARTKVGSGKLSSTSIGTGSATAPVTLLMGTSYPGSLVVNYVTSGETTANMGSSAYNIGISFLSLSFTTDPIPCVGWGAGTTVTPDQTNVGWTSYTPDSTYNQGLGTVTNTVCRYRLDGEDGLLRCKFRTGTVSAAEARLGLPPGWVTADSNKIDTLELAGPLARAVSGAAYYSVLMEPSKNYLTFGLQQGGTAGLAKANGNAVFGNTEDLSFQARVPLANRRENGKASQLANTVSNGSDTIVSLSWDFIFAGASVTTNCSSSPCTVYDSTGPSGLTVTRNSNGNYSIGVPSGTCSTRLICTGNGENGSTILKMMTDLGNTTSTLSRVAFISDAGSGVDVRASVHCGCVR